MQLLRFSVTNFACFRDVAEVSFVSASLKDQPDFRIHHPSLSYGILPVLGVYGANAAGKSFLLESLTSHLSLVRHSFSFQPEQDIPWNPWKLEKESDSKPSEFDIDVSIGGTRYQYGFTYNSEAFLEEWLYRWQPRRQVLFERKTDDDEPWYFGPALTGEKVSLSKLTRRNSLFLSTAAQNNHETLGAVHRALTTEIRREKRIELSGYPLFTKSDPIIDPERRDQVEAAIKAFDIGIKRIRVERLPKDPQPNEEKLSEFLKPQGLELLRETLLNDDGYFRIVLEREGPDGKTWTLPPHSESRGTHILLRRIDDFMSLESGVIVIDELETSLHPEVCASLLKLFTSEESNTRGVQMLFSTHSRSILDQLRRDEVILIDKEPDGASQVSSAADYKDIRSRQSLRVLHERGQVGSVPILGNLDPIWNPVPN